MHWSEVSARWHDDYERGRPGYPQEVTRVAGLPRSAVVLELGAGTGKLTRLLLDEFAQVLAVEPDPAMRRRFVALCPQATLLGGAAEQIPLGDASVDGVFSAEAFHWFSHEQARDEIARVLRPGGALVLVWNRPAGPIEPAIDDVEKLLEPNWPQEFELPLDLNPSRATHARDWPKAFAESAFEPLQERLFANPHEVDQDGLVAFFGSMGWLAALPDTEFNALFDDIRSRLTATRYRLPFETDVHWTRLRPI
jgi:SAM-dependent methyltransferase